MKRGDKVFLGIIIIASLLVALSVAFPRIMSQVLPFTTYELTVSNVPDENIAPGQEFSPTGRLKAYGTSDPSEVAAREIRVTGPGVPPVRGYHVRLRARAVGRRRL